MMNRRKWMFGTLQCTILPLTLGKLLTGQIAFAYEGATLDHANIDFFLPKGDDKDADTSVSVSVTAKINNQFNDTIASKTDFAGTDHWEDGSGKHYQYSLDITSPIAKSQIPGGVTTKIEIHPNGKDTVKFQYHLELVFSDGTMIQQDRSGIVLDQNNRTFTS